MPIDTCKTVLQVDSTAGFRSLVRKVKAGNIGVLYQGAFANYFSAIVGHYPWFFTYNFLTNADWVINTIDSKVRPANRNTKAGVLEIFSRRNERTGSVPNHVTYPFFVVSHRRSSSATRSSGSPHRLSQTALQTS